MKLIFSPLELENFTDALSREWLDTNGCGGYASGTLVNCHTRKYHGLLVASLLRPSGCFTLLSHYEDWIDDGSNRTFLVTHQYGGDVLQPQGHTRQVQFDSDLYPRFIYRWGELTVTREILMVNGENTVLVRYQVEGGSNPVTLGLRPLISFRQIHQVTHANTDLNPQTEPLVNGFKMHPYNGMPDICFQVSQKPVFTPQPCWYNNFHYRQDVERGFEHREDLFSPGILEIKLKPGQSVIIAASTGTVAGTLGRLWQQEENRRQKATLADTAAVPAGWEAKTADLYTTLRRAARQFLIELPEEGPAVHAGYHWFGPWGRDTLIALPGLAFLAGDREMGVRILKIMARFERRGLLPNFINPDGTAVYTAADSSLWFFWSVQQYLKAGGDLEVVRRDLWPTMLSILRNYQLGTDNGIMVDQEGLVRAGSPGAAVTWMDAQVGGRPVLPRWGYMVEINALWYNAVCFTFELKKKFNEYIEELESDYDTRIRHAFVRKFWQPASRVLLDNINEFCTDSSVRPNQIFAVSLPNSPLNLAQQKAVVQTVRQELFTPFGLRSLSPQDMRYRGVCQGENWLRELAYHQGSVWPWLLAHYAEAVFRAEGRNKQTRAQFTPVLEAFCQHLSEAGIGSISEVFDGDSPHTPRGAISQAWNVGEVLRLLTLI